MIRTCLYTILLCSLTNFAFGQSKKAKAAFEDQRFHDAIVILDKEIESGKQNDEVFKLYGLSSFYAGKFDQAEETTLRLIDKNPENDDYKYVLIKTLLAKKEFDQARDAWNTISPASKQHPDFVLLSNSIVSQSKWERIVSKLEVSNFDEINTSAGDYSPFLYGDDIIFCTLDKADLINMEELDPREKDFSKLYKKKLGQFESKNPHEFLPGLIHGKHIGPISISTDKKEIFYTSASQLRAGVNYNDIFSISKNEEGKWGRPKPFAYNNEDYNVAHPALSEDGKTLYFSSDKPGGFGQMDLYYCYRTENGWSEPINLGENVNTSKNEVFPSQSDGYLYFASNGHPGYGKLDLYRVEETDYWEFVENLKSPLNSPYDDFGVCFKNENSGFFSSNRPGGSGKDDVYKFGSIEVAPAVETQYITGLFEKEQVGLKNKKVVLVDENGTVLQEAYTNAQGEFFFLKEKDITNYSIRLDEDLEDYHDLDMLLTDSNGNVTEIVEADENGNFSFEILALDDYDNLVMMEQTDNNLLSINIGGQLFREEYGDFNKEEEVSIVNRYGIIVGKTITDSTGTFLFENMKPDDQYIFKLSSNDEALKIAIFDEDGEPVQIIIADKNMRYYFERLKADDDYISMINSEDEEIYIKENEAFVFSNVYYELNSAELNSESEVVLDRLTVLLYNNPHVSIVIRSHTDSRATDKYNLKLSQKRAESVAAYLISRGIDVRRLDAKGMGERDLVNHCSNGVECTNEQHAENRRTEFEIRKNENF
ncbi:MAG: OmpA family protein [Flavobacteriales bacterium]|nr:OmpA family protein [Flavobacteriales bacterium]